MVNYSLKRRILQEHMTGTMKQTALGQRGTFSDPLETKTTTTTNDMKVTFFKCV